MVWSGLVWLYTITLESYLRDGWMDTTTTTTTTYIPDSTNYKSTASGANNIGISLTLTFHSCVSVFVPPAWFLCLVNLTYLQIPHICHPSHTSNLILFTYRIPHTSNLIFVTHLHTSYFVADCVRGENWCGDNFRLNSKNCKRKKSTFWWKVVHFSGKTVNSMWTKIESQILSANMRFDHLPHHHNHFGETNAWKGSILIW